MRRWRFKGPRGGHSNKEVKQKMWDKRQRVGSAKREEEENRGSTHGFPLWQVAGRER